MGHARHGKHVHVSSRPQGVCPRSAGTAKELVMPYYLVQGAYTPEAWAAQLKTPQNRAELIKPLLQQVGARLESFYYAFGESDVVVTLEVPDNVSAAALSLAVTA